MTAVHRLAVTTVSGDPRSDSLTADAHALGIAAVERVDVEDLVFLRADLDDDAKAAITSLLVDPLLQRAAWGASADDATAQPARTVVVETTLHPGVTDASSSELLRAAGALHAQIDAASTGKRFTITGDLDDADTDRLVRRLLANPVIERWSTGGAIEPAFPTGEQADSTVTRVPLGGLSDDELLALDRERGLSLDLAELRVIQEHFAVVGRDPTDVELETLAQTWSEHCSHKTFRALITTPEGQVIRPLLAQLRDSTDTIAAPFVRSAFVGNAGIVSFVPGRTIAVKAETHNHPSAVEPFGGANTGVGGVIRDVMGTAHRPIATTDILCFGLPDLDPAELPDGVLHPRRIERGVVEGVADYGNKIGLPTVAGAVLYDDRYTANPLVFCGCIGVADDSGPLPGPQPGDRVVSLGGRTGRDGLRGATFSSRTMDATTGEVAGASVQIGDPIIEKLLIDLLDDIAGLFTAITDCGAGGLSSAVGEMAEGIGADVDLATVPLKYPGLAPWEIWLSEAQERMVLAVPPMQLATVEHACRRHGVELTDLGSFTGDGLLRVHYGDTAVLELDTRFLHDGRPQRTMTAVLPTPDRTAGAQRRTDDPAGTLLALLGHRNIASKADIVHRYDHEIRGATVVRPLVGAELDGPADGVVLAEPADTQGIAIGIGVNPWFGEHDPELMARAAVDEAMRNVVAVGADPDRVALLDNFSWGDPRRPSTLGALAAAVTGCCDGAGAHGAPFVSGKDSLNNEYVGADGERHSVPPTLVITAIAHVPDAGRCVTTDLAEPGNVLVLVGRTLHEFAGSHFDLVHGAPDDLGTVPTPDADAHRRYRRLHAVMRAGLVRSCHDLSEGGLAVAVAEMAIGGRLGATIEQLPTADAITSLFAESTGRFVLEVAPGDVGELTDALDEPVLVLGTVTATPELRLPGCRTLTIDELLRAWQRFDAEGGST
ncbi:MAG: phosphoribosylformylglycinamidine synthase subunit PurL [Acidimicrobiia bacterium]